MAARAAACDEHYPALLRELGLADSSGAALCHRRLLDPAQDNRAKESGLLDR